jgi:hypothetical protein
VQQRGVCEIGIRLNVVRMYKSTSSVKKDTCGTHLLVILSQIPERPAVALTLLTGVSLVILYEDYNMVTLAVCSGQHNEITKGAEGHRGAVAVTLEPRKQLISNLGLFQSPLGST